MIRASKAILTIIISILLLILLFQPVESSALPSSSTISIEYDYQTAINSLTYDQILAVCKKQLESYGNPKNANIAFSEYNPFQNPGRISAEIYPEIAVLLDNTKYYVQFGKGYATVYTSDEFGNIIIVNGNLKEEVLGSTLSTYFYRGLQANFDVAFENDSYLVTPRDCSPIN